MPVSESVDTGSIAQKFLREFEEQAPIMRRYLERVPEEKLTWKPHQKSMTAGQLALHIARVPGQIIAFVQSNPAPAPKSFVTPQPESREEILEALDESVAKVRRALPEFGDAEMNETWRMQAEGRTVVEMPRAKFLRDVMFSHVYQHRGQLCVYLRLLDVPVPASWGPSADEPPLFMQHP
ncbi:MAG TPA: DinB family protein [Terracidiphilus sp.]|nr:DinB family protein [Terracidiphilus sp.]